MPRPKLELFKKNKNKSFTLVEISVVFSIAMLVVSLVAVSATSARDKSRIARASLFEKHVHSALGDYAVGILNFDEGSGDVTTDGSGSSRFCTLEKKPTWRCASDNKDNTPSGKGCSLEFDGNNDYVTCGSDERFSFEDTYRFTLSAWYKITGSSASHYGLLSKGIYQPTHMYRLTAGINSVGLSLSGKHVSSTALCSSCKSPINTWHHIAVEMTGTQVKFYFDGKLEGKSNLYRTNFLEDKVGPLTIGYVPGTSDNDYFKGYIDDVMIFDKMMAAGEIKSLYAKGLQKRLAGADL